MFGVPVGSYTIVMNLDLSDMGPFSQSPQDLIRIGLATDSQVNGTKFQTSENLSTLPQIIFLNKTVEVLPLWGEPEICQPSITRTDFDLTAEANITIKPTAIFMGSIFSDVDKGALKKNCKPKLKSGQMCSLVSGPGQILAVRQTIKQDINGRPILEEYELENNGNVIDYDGTWLLDTPMNMDYIITNEFGEQIFSNDERKGVPTKAKYRFKIRWTQPPDLSASVKRGTFLVPNVKEHGWTSSSANSDPILLQSTDINYRLLKASYAFSKDWADYGVIGDTDGETMIQDAIDCKDMFYEMTYNKVYTISQLITRYTKGTLNRRYLGIKNITDEECDNSSNKLPTNDAQYKPDLLFIAFTILLGFLSIIIKIIVKIFHIICALAYAILNFQICLPFRIGCRRPFENNSVLKKIIERFSTINLPLYSYPDCEICSCTVPSSPSQQSGIVSTQAPFVNNSVLADFIDPNSYDVSEANDYNDFTPVFQQICSGFQGTDLNNTWSTFRTPLISLFRYDNDGDGDGPLEYNGIYTLDLPLHERVTLMNFKGKFFGNGVFNDITKNTPLNISPSYSSLMLGGGTSQIKVCFNTDLNTPNLNWDQLNNGLNLNSTTNGFHYDNVLILAVEDKYPAGTILTFNNPYSFNDKNLSGATLNSYGATSITGTPINISSASTVNISHTNPYTGERLVTAYLLNQTNEDNDKYLRYPTDIEYFQVITAMTRNDMAVPMDFYNVMNQCSFIYRVMDKWSSINNYSVSFNVQATNWSYTNPWVNFNQKESTYFTILVRGVDPHSTRQPVTYGLGRLFSNYDHWRISVSGNYKLNIPLQPNDGLDFGDAPIGTNNNSARDKAHRCVKHDGLGDTNSGVDFYSSGRTFFKSFHFKPSSTDWTQFRTRSIYKYSSLSETDYDLDSSTGFYPNVNFSSIRRYTTIAPPAFGGGLRVGINNFFSRKSNYDAVLTPSNGEQFTQAGYVVGESVEGGSIMITGGDSLNWNGNLNSTQLFYRRYSAYYSKKYVEPTNDSDCFLMSDSERIVMRTDRMPTSDRVQVFQGNSGSNSMTMMANGQFYISEVSDDGVVTANITVSPTFVVNEPEIIPYNPAEPEIPNKIAALLDSFTCNSLVPIECYSSGPNDTVNIAPESQCQFYQSQRFFVAGSCYSLVREPYNEKNNVKNDIELVNEWYSRMNINFGACREVFSHGFFNSWINGTLYAFPFRNTRYFTGPNANPPSQPYNKVCTTNIFIHPDTFNFYYRSAPYRDSNSRFIGRDGDETVGGNKKNHMYPTTIMDLGPRDELQKFLSQSGNWDGYIMNKLDSTTFGDTSDLLNIFVISRLANTSFTDFFKSRTSSVLNFFDSRKRKFVDGDFAQMIATNSQFGIASYEPESYPEPTGTTFNSSLFLPTFFDKTKDIVFGIFYTGDSQSRDYISPNRTIYNPNGRIGIDDDCAFSYIPLKTQVVPFYLWDIKNNQSVSNIFGNQENNWSDDIFSYNYQGIDRLYAASRNFQPSPSIDQINYHKGWIYNVDDYSTLPANPINDATGEFDYKPKDGIPGSYLLGAPFYFYFGLTKGASAFDRFTAKWIDTDGFV